jgi:putative membrane protein
MIAPIFLALGAPLTLALRTLPVRARRLLIRGLHSRAVRVLTFPLVTFAIFVANPWVLYFTGLYRLTLENDLLHDWVHVHFLVTGCLFLWPLIGIDPLPGRWPYPARALLMLMSTPFHAFLGVTIMQGRQLIAGDYYPALHLGWVTPAADQNLAGAVLWAGGDLVSVTMLAALIGQWIRASERETARIDRHLDRLRAVGRRAAVSAQGGPATDGTACRDRPAAAVVTAPGEQTDDEPVWEKPWWETAGPG